MAGASKATKTVRAGVVCGTDFSARAREAASAAAAVANRMGQPLLLVHALDDPRYEGLPAAAKKALMTRQVESLAAEATRLGRRGPTVIHEVHVGHADEVIAERARQAGARLVVVGAVGTRASDRFRLGSVAERTVGVSSVPVLVVRDDAPFEAWVKGRRPLRVFAGFDFTVTSEAALEWVRDLSALGPCDVTVGHLMRAPETLERLGLADAPAPPEATPLVQEAVERDVRDRVTLLLGTPEVAVRVQAAVGRRDLELLNMAARAEADLVVTGTHQLHGLPRLWHGSVSTGLLVNASLSVACVPVAAARRRVPRVPVIRRVLVTTDLSPLGNRAIAHALAIVPPGGHVRLIHIVHPRALAGGEYEDTPRTTKAHVKHVAEVGRRLQGLVPAEAAALGLVMEAAIVEATDVAEGICQEAERYGADVVVMGSRGLSGLARAVVGSTTTEVMERSRRPVFVVRLPEE
ncbi:MAG: universal stress protein [Acidobacteriota bacterium]